ncbi:PP2C family protein-serine/threonine phosphatase [Cytobacillus sp. FJAT-54145]|uniref:PP2C family protein-serine/threonine phosphatase n=1 Tax=Cytobacillus spartinae TaxID=3299023 RepID=A0ABW6KJH4_9BACI
MAIYLLNTNPSEIKVMKEILYREHEEVYLVNLESLIVNSGPSRIKPSSLLIFKGKLFGETIQRALQFCRYHQLPLLAITNKASFYEDVSVTPDLLFDVVSEPTDTELLLRVRLLLTYQKEVNRRIKKEKELEKAINALTEELEFAKRIQQLVLPNEFTRDDIKIRAIYEPSELLSGDLYYWTKIAPHEYGLILIDVSGHGVHAALVSMAMRSLFPGLFKRVKNPSIIAKELNEHMLKMFEQIGKEKYVTSYFTAFIMYVNTQERKISYVNAGHQPGLLLQNGKLSSLEKGMVPIGLIHEPQIECETIFYEAPGKLLLFTDGLIETPYSLKANYLEDVKNYLFTYEHKDEQHMLEKILSDRKKLAPVSDDICAIALTVL